MEKKLLLLTITLLCMVAQGTWAWDGHGTQSDPYLIQSIQDWKDLASQVAAGNNQDDEFFRLTTDLDLEGNNIGSESKAFSGTFDGDGHTLTYNRGGAKSTGFEVIDDYCAPFVRLDGATIRHLNVKGGIYSSHKYAASIASIIDGDRTTTILDCNSSCTLWADSKLKEDATFGGLVGLVKETCKADPVIKDCTFTGNITNFCTNSATFVGFTNRPITFDHCMSDTKEFAFVSGCATYVRTATNVTYSLKNCYYTRVFGEKQGEVVFNKISVPEGCTGKIVSEATVNFNGVEYWQNGATIELTAPDNVTFHHWATNTGGCFISNPWQRSGVQIVRDIQQAPNFGIETAKPTPKKERTMDGTNYLYLSRTDYHLYLSDELCQQKGFYLNKDGWLVKKVNDKEIFVTAVNGWDNGHIPSDGAQIHNDLSGYFNDYTLMACIAPYAFKGCTDLKTLYFKDTDANAYNAQTPFDFIIGDMAFADCPNLTEIKMMQYTTKGSNHWEALAPNQVSYVSSNVFENSPNATFSTDASQYQAYMGSETWKELRKNIIVYNHTFNSNSFDVNGAKYNLFYTTAGDAIKNTNDGHNAILQQLRLWNGDYQQFNAAQLLSNSEENIWYTQVLGADNDYLKKKDVNGVMRIYNDPGSYYNYKTIAIKSLGGSKDVRAIEFWQTNGRSSNSLSEPKMIIMNNAFQGCDSLKELRMFYCVEDGEKHWTALGPTDVIPGDNIFGVKKYTEEDIKNGGINLEKDPEVPKGFKILVATQLYSQFMDDPNWQAYLGYIEPVDFTPSPKKDFTKDGLTYSFMTSLGGIRQTSQTVSQDVSWWTAPRIAAEVLLWSTSIASAVAKPSAASVRTAGLAMHQAGQELTVAQTNKELIASISADIASAIEERSTERIATTIGGLFGQDPAKYLISKGSIEILRDRGLIGVNNTFILTQRSLEQMAARNWEKFMFTALDFSQAIPSVKTLSQAVTTAENALAAATNASNAIFRKQTLWNVMENVLGLAATTSALSGQAAVKCWGGSDTYNGELLKKGIRNNVIANMHQVSLVGGSYVITTPSKNIIYHTYIKDVAQDLTDATIYAGFDDDGNSYTSNRTMTFAKKAFRDHKKLKTVSFHSMENQSSNVGAPMLFTIPDSAFVGCNNLVEFSTLLKDNEKGTRPLGPENFILGGDSIFAGLDSTKFHIVIDPSRKDDFLQSESWAPLKRYFTYQEAMPKAKLKEYGAHYAYAYENNSILREHKVKGHLIQHTEVTGADNEFINEHQGALKLCNDIGEWNNYQLDAVHRKAFMGNENLRVVNFTDLYGKGAFGDSYTGLEMTLGDSCFANCKNLVNLDLLYLVTDGNNRIDPIKPAWVKIGNGILDGTTARIKMMPEQVAWFEADTTWVKYKDRFLPCIIHPSDDGIRAALKPMAYYDMAHTGNDWKLWDNYIDLARLSGAGFAWLDGKFTAQKDNILSFYDFKYFDCIGLDYVGKEWFRGCALMSNIMLPQTIKTIQEHAFDGCAKLQEIELPAATTKIESGAFGNCGNLNTIIVRGTTPAKLGEGVFTKHEGMKIYVPANSLDAYLNEWAEYKDYIVSESKSTVKKVVTVKEKGTLADELGLYVEWSYSGSRAGDEPRYIHGNYSKYDSLTISGPLNTLDLWVIRYLAGNNGYERGTVPTDGQLRYLNLYNASIRKDGDCKANYINLSTLFFHDGWEKVEEDDNLPRFLFYNCTPLETIILPKDLKKVSARVFAGCSNLKRVAITSALEDYDEWGYTSGLLDYPLEELVFTAKEHAKSNRKNPWGRPLQVVYTRKSLYEDYLNDPCVINQTMNVVAPFEDDAVWDLMVESGEFFPSVVTEKEDLGRLFSEVWKENRLKTFDGFQFFNKVKRLDETFLYNLKLERVSIPASVEYIMETAFEQCRSLKTITMKGDSVPKLEDDAFRFLPEDFVIYVPRNAVKAYRTKWTQYADHINPEKTSATNDDIRIVTLTEPNTLAEKLGLTPTWVDATSGSTKLKALNGVRGDYTNITKLKVIGPISGGDLSLLRYMAGFCPWSNTRNYAGRLEYIDLYDTDLKATNYCVAPDVITTRKVYVEEENVLPAYSFLQCYNLKSLILPRTLKEVRSRALQQCETMETLVLGDDMEEFNWNALDDDASLTRMYILAKKKVKITTENTVWRWLCNNYNPTFDAFYVRPSQYENYMHDEAYTGSSWQRTNNISKGTFDDDDAFSAFASHAAATPDELIGIRSVDGWFKNHTGVKDLTALRYTAVDSLSKATMTPLTKLERVAMPVTLKGLEDSLFVKSKGLRYVDFLFCDSTEIVSGLRKGGFKRLGINTGQTLVYVPYTYGESDSTNIVVSMTDGKFKAKAFRMVDSLNYIVPYAFETSKIENTRSLPVSSVPYTVCVPYKTNVPAYSRAYILSERSGNTLVFQEVSGELEAMKPYLLKVVGSKRFRKNSTTLNTDIEQTIPANGGNTYGQQIDEAGYTLRGTFDAIDNKTANEMGAYILQSDGDWHPVASSTDAEKKAVILPYRAYLLGNTNAARSRSIGMTLYEEGVTGIENIETIDEDGTHRYYDLDGRELPGKPLRGMYIFNGKKYINK